MGWPVEKAVLTPPRKYGEPKEAKPMNSKEPPPKWIAPTLRSLREERGMSLHAVAARAKVCHKHLGDVEGGTVTPSVAWLEKVLGALDHDLEVMPR